MLQILHMLTFLVVRLAYPAHRLCTDNKLQNNQVPYKLASGTVKWKSIS